MYRSIGTRYQHVFKLKKNVYRNIVRTHVNHCTSAIHCTSALSKTNMDKTTL